MLGPMNRFDTQPALQGQFKQGKKVYPLTGLVTANIIIHMHHPLKDIHKFGRGSVVITDPISGMFTYNWHQNDTSMEGLWEVWVELRTANGPLSSTNVEMLDITKRTSGYMKNVVGRMKIV